MWWDPLHYHINKLGHVTLSYWWPTSVHLCSFVVLAHYWGFLDSGQQCGILVSLLSYAGMALNENNWIWHQELCFYSILGTTAERNMHPVSLKGDVPGYSQPYRVLRTGQGQLSLYLGTSSFTLGICLGKTPDCYRAHGRVRSGPEIKL